MFRDFSEIADDAFNADVCIIGAGAAGFAGAVSLLNSGLKILILEGGLHTFNQEAANLHQGEVVGQKHAGIHDARERVVGGTTTKWGGQAYPFMKEDFEKRPYMSKSGWPLSFSDVAPYYAKAESILGTDASVPFDYRPWKDWGIEEPAFSRSVVDMFVTKWCKIPNFAQQHGKKIELSDTVTLLRNANVVELLPDEFSSRVDSLRIRSLSGKEGIVRAGYVIAAGGAMETVRLFLVSKKFGENGLANKHGLVGAYFQDHIASIVGQVFPYSRSKFHNIFNPFYKKGFKYLPRMKLNPSFARNSEILHASAQIVFTTEKDSFLGAAKSAIAAIREKKLPSKEIVKSLLKPSKLYRALHAAARWKIAKRGSSSKVGPIWLEIHSEQEPSCKSNIRLSNKVDTLGMQRISLNWNISDLTVHSIRTTAKTVATELKKAGVAEVKLEPWVESDLISPFRWLTDTYHQAGGLVMASDESTGVVDADCKVFGINNLYVASSAVFPTSSFSNPTMTTIALGIRIAETVEKRFKNGMV